MRRPGGSEGWRGRERAIKSILSHQEGEDGEGGEQKASCVVANEGMGWDGWMYA